MDVIFNMYFYEVLNFFHKIITFPRIVAACMYSLLHIPLWTCQTCFACVPPLLPAISLIWQERPIVLKSVCVCVCGQCWEMGVKGSGCRLLLDSSRAAIWRRTFAAGCLECCRDRGARSYRRGNRVREATRKRLIPLTHNEHVNKCPSYSVCLYCSM